MAAVQNLYNDIQLQFFDIFRLFFKGLKDLYLKLNFRIEYKH